MISIGIIGVGYWGPNYARIVSNMEGVCLRWCCDLDEKALAKMKRLYPTVQTTTQASDLLSDSTLDAVIIVTPAQFHAELASAMLRAGKDVLIEKPITVTSKDAQKLCALAEENVRVLMVDHTFLFNNAVIDLQERIQKKELGKILYLYGEYNALGPIRRDVSAMWDLPHFLYVADYIIGERPVAVRALGRSFLQKRMEDVVFLNVEYENNVMFNLQCSWIDPVKIRKLVVVGDKKMAIFDDMQQESKLSLYDKGVEISSDPNFANLQMAIRNGDTLLPRIQPSEPLTECVHAFVQAIHTRKVTRCGGREGLDLVVTLEAAEKSLKHEGKRIEIKKI